MESDKIQKLLTENDQDNEKNLKKFLTKNGRDDRI